MRSHYLITSFFFCLLLISVKPAKSQHLKGIKESIDSTIVLDFKVIPQGAGKSRIEIPSETVKLYPDASYFLAGRAMLVAEELRIMFFGISKASAPAAQVLSPATTVLAVDSVEHGEYIVSFIVQGDTSEGKMILGKNGLLLRADSIMHFQLKRKEVMAPPSDLVVGYARYESEFGHLFDAFMDSMMVMGAYPEVLKAGDYGDFQIDKYQRMQIPATEITRQIILSYSGDPKELAYFIGRYRKNHPEVDFYFFYPDLK